MTVGQPAIDQARPPVAQNVHGMGGRTVDAQVAGEAIAGSAGDEPQGGGGSHQRRSDLIEGAVAAHGDDQRAALRERADGKIVGVARALRMHRRAPGFLDEPGERGKIPGGVAGTWVDNKAGFQFLM